MVGRDDGDAVEVTFEDGTVTRLSPTADGLRRLDPAQEGRISPSWREINAPSRFDPPLARGELTLLRLLDRTLSSGWEIFVRPHLDGDLPSVAILHPLAGAVLLDVVEVADVAHPALIEQRNGFSRAQPAMRLERVRKRMYGSQVPALAQGIIADPRHFGVIRLALYLPLLSNDAVTRVMADHPHVRWLAGTDPEPGDLVRLLPSIPREARLTPAEYEDLRTAFSHHYGNPAFHKIEVLRGRQAILGQIHARTTPHHRSRR